MSARPNKPPDRRRQEIPSSDESDTTSDPDDLGTSDSEGSTVTLSSTDSEAKPTRSTASRAPQKQTQGAVRRTQSDRDSVSSLDSSQSEQDSRRPSPKQAPKAPKSPDEKKSRFTEEINSPEAKDSESPKRQETAKESSSKSRASSRRRESREPSRIRPSSTHDLEKGEYRYEGKGNHGEIPFCSSCEGCGECWAGMVEWRIWSWIRRRSAFLVALVTGIGMSAAGFTGAVDIWVFASLNGKDLGGVGYCESGDCKIDPLHDIEKHNAGVVDLFTSTFVLSALLLLLSLIGISTLLFLLYLFLSAQFGAGTFHPPHKRFLCGSRFSTDRWQPSESDLRRVCIDNGIQQKWQDTDLTENEKLAMLNDSRRKTCFQMYMFWFAWPFGILITGLLWLWVNVADAEEKLAFEITIYGGMVMILLYLISVNIYRPTVEGATRKKLSRSYLIAAEEARMLKSKAAATGKNLSQIASTVKDKTGDGMRTIKDNVTPNSRPRRGPRRPGGRDV